MREAWIRSDLSMLATCVVLRVLSGWMNSRSLTWTCLIQGACSRIASSYGSRCVNARFAWS